MHSYCVSGLSVDSEIVLPGLIALAAGRGQPDVTIRQRPVPAALENASTIEIVS